MAVAPIAAAPMPTTRPAIRYAKHALDTANRATDAGADRTTDRTANRTSRTIAFTRTLVRTTLHASKDALRVRQMWNGKKGQSGCCGCRRELKAD
ncbi:MAG: hypothetical protein BGN91_07430 [Nitrobacter sp. 62-13]|nr:MAG: hypothetical protein BGN91_07430 [Nitrobacter sp. 62-13]